MKEMIPTEQRTIRLLRFTTIMASATLRLASEVDMVIQVIQYRAIRSR